MAFPMTADPKGHKEEPFETLSDMYFLKSIGGGPFLGSSILSSSSVSSPESFSSFHLSKLIVSQCCLAGHFTNLFQYGPDSFFCNTNLVNYVKTINRLVRSTLYNELLTCYNLTWNRDMRKNEPSLCSLYFL